MCLRTLLMLTLYALADTFLVEDKFYDPDFMVSGKSALPTIRLANSSWVFYGIMCDAGSTGTRTHIYTFNSTGPGELPVLDNEMFFSVKPGLSSYVNSPAKAGDTMRQMLKVAMKVVPPTMWAMTPIFLRATAGLRLLPQEKAQALLTQVQKSFSESPFFVPDDSIGIMDGTREGILAWVTVNFLTGHLCVNTSRTAGILDLGGASTQITFLPTCKKTVETAPADHIAKFDMFNTTYQLYTYSYLGNGIEAARLATLGALDNEELKWKVFKSSCLPRQFRGEWTFGGFTYNIAGPTDGSTSYKTCYQEVLKAIKGVIHQPYEIHGSAVFYAFSFYYERAVDSGLIDSSQGAVMEVKGFKNKAKEVCREESEYHHPNPFLCMDLTYITTLLKDGFGFKDSTVLQLTKKVNKVEASWALGAMFESLHKLKIH